MRIVHIGKFYPPFAGGIERFVADLAEAQVRAGHEVTVLCYQHEPWRPTERQTIQGVDVRRVAQLGQFIYAPISPGFGRELARTLADVRPDVLHLHMPNTAGLTLLRSRAARRLPWIMHWHADVLASQHDPRLRLAYRFYRPMERAVLRRAQRVIATSEPYLDSSVALASVRDKATVVPLGLNAARLPEPTAEQREWAESQWRPNELRLLTIGRLTYYKGHNVLVEAAARTPGVQAIIVGGGGTQRSVRETVRQLGVEDRVKLAGFLPDEQAHALLATCDCFTLPSLERTEAFGVVLLEAMRYARPLLVSDIPGSGVGYVVDHGNAGMTARPGDVDAWANALATLRDDAALRQRLADAAQRRFEQQFDIDRVREQIDQVYASVM